MSETVNVVIAGTPTPVTIFPNTNIVQLTGDLVFPDGPDFSASSGSALVGFLQSGTGAVARTAQSKMRERISLADFTGFDNTGATSINACLALAKAYCDTLTVTPDANGPQVRARLFIPPGTYLLTANAALPLEVECEGRFTGAFKLTLTQVKRAYIKGLSCATLKISGSFFGTFDDIYANIEMDGGGFGFGTFWNSFKGIVGNIVIDQSNFSVNQNKFEGRGGFSQITSGVGSGALDAHANNLDNWDFTGGTYSNTSSVQQDSLLIGTYYESGADIVGPAHLFGFQGDAEGPPRVGRRNHILGAYDVIEKNRADFIATGANILAGGAWDNLDNNGKPPCISSSGGTTVALDTTEPFGLGVKYGGAFTGAFTGFAITIPPCATGKFSLLVAYKGDDFTTVQVDRGGGGGTSFGGKSVVAIDGGWKLLRLSGRGSATANTVVTLFAFDGTGGAKTINIGGMYATQEKAAQYPAPSYIREAHGAVTQAYVSGSTFIDVVVTFPKAFASAPTVITTIGDNGATTINYSKVIIRSLTTTGFTARVYYTTDWTGIVHWFARGVN